MKTDFLFALLLLAVGIAAGMIIESQTGAVWRLLNAISGPPAAC